MYSSYRIRYNGSWRDDCHISPSIWCSVLGCPVIVAKWNSHLSMQVLASSNFLVLVTSRKLMYAALYTWIKSVVHFYQQFVNTERKKKKDEFVVINSFLFYFDIRNSKSKKEKFVDYIDNSFKFNLLSPSHNMVVPHYLIQYQLLHASSSKTILVWNVFSPL